MAKFSIPVKEFQQFVVKQGIHNPSDRLLGVGKVVRVKSNVAEVFGAIHRLFFTRISEATIFLQKRVQRNISKKVETGSGRFVFSKDATKLERKDPSNATGFQSFKVRSKPGEYPRYETGDLSASIRKTTDIVATQFYIEGIVGTNLQYGVDLELGTKRIKDRSYLVRTLREERKFIYGLLMKKASVGAMRAAGKLVPLPSYKGGRPIDIQPASRQKFYKFASIFSDETIGKLPVK